MGIARPKKRRNHRKVKQRNNIKPWGLKVSDEKVRAMWDKKKTVRENYAAMGLNTEFNKVNPLQDVIQESKTTPDGFIVVEELPIPLPDNSAFDDVFTVPESAPPREAHLSEGEQAYYRKLIDLYGNDYEAMGRDHKNNYYQHTARKCEKKCELYLSKYMNGLPKSKKKREAVLAQQASDSGLAGKATSSSSSSSSSSSFSSTSSSASISSSSSSFSSSSSASSSSSSSSSSTASKNKRKANTATEVSEQTLSINSVELKEKKKKKRAAAS